MTVVGDEVIKLLELGDVFRWVTDGERAKALELLERDTRFDATITQLQSGKVLRDFLQGTSISKVLLRFTTP